VCGVVWRMQARSEGSEDSRERMYQDCQAGSRDVPLASYRYTAESMAGRWREEGKERRAIGGSTQSQLSRAV
jgi:hypothetical protein